MPLLGIKSLVRTLPGTRLGSPPPCWRGATGAPLFPVHSPPHFPRSSATSCICNHINMLFQSSLCSFAFSRFCSISTRRLLRNSAEENVKHLHSRKGEGLTCWSIGEFPEFFTIIFNASAANTDSVTVRAPKTWLILSMALDTIIMIITLPLHIT